jgi:hypothetical protein
MSHTAFQQQNNVLTVLRSPIAQTVAWTSLTGGKGKDQTCESLESQKQNPKKRFESVLERSSVLFSSELDNNQVHDLSARMISAEFQALRANPGLNV